jgi:hypothetical protein
MENIIEKKREFLEDNLSRINDLISTKLGFKTNLQIVEKKNYRGKKYFSIEDNTNIREMCGVIKYAFKYVYIYTSHIFFDEDVQNIQIEFDFGYVHIDGGMNGAVFCNLVIKDGEITEV